MAHPYNPRNALSVPGKHRTPCITTHYFKLNPEATCAKSGLAVVKDQLLFAGAIASGEAAVLAMVLGAQNYNIPGIQARLKLAIFELPLYGRAFNYGGISCETLVEILTQPFLQLARRLTLAQP